MSDESDKIVDLYPAQEESLISRAIDAMGRAYRRKKAEEHASLNGGVVFVDDEGNEVGHLIPLDDPDA